MSVESADSKIEGNPEDYGIRIEKIGAGLTIAALLSSKTKSERERRLGVNLYR